MKQSIFVLIFLGSMCFGSSIQAQNKIQIGIGLGLNYATLDHAKNAVLSNFPNNLGYRLLPTFKGCVDVPLGSRYSIAFEPGISWQGASTNGELESLDYNDPYLDMAVKGKVKMIEGIGLLVGANYAYLLNNDNLPETNHFIYGQFGVFAGLFDWVEISLTSNHAINSVYDFQLTDVNGNPIGTSDLKSRYIQLSVLLLH